MNRRSFISMSSAGSLWAVTPQSQLRHDSALNAVGLIGGTSWYSTIDYYRTLNQLTNQKLGEKFNPPLFLANLNQATIHHLQDQGRWESIAELYIATSHQLIRAGAEAIAFCANTPHTIYDQIQAEVSKPILHIADATARAIKRSRLSTVGLVGTKFTMSEPFFLQRLSKIGVRTLLPDASGKELLHQLVVNQLAHGNFNAENQGVLLKEMESLSQQGAMGIVLACTEFPMLIKQSDFPYPIFDTTRLHCEFITEFIFSE